MNIEQHRLYTLANIKTSDVAFVLEFTPAAVWHRVIKRQLLGTGHTRETLKKLGWRAIRVSLKAENGSST